MFDGGVSLNQDEASQDDLTRMSPGTQDLLERLHPTVGLGMSGDPPRRSYGWAWIGEGRASHTAAAPTRKS